jgi:hypothetical protein
MASSNEIIQIEQINKALTTLNTTIDGTAAGVMKVIKGFQDYEKTAKNVTVTAESLTKTKKEANEIDKQKESFTKQLISVENQLKQAEDGTLKTLIEKKLALKAEIAAITESITGSKASAEAEKKLTAEKKEAEKQSKLQAAATAKAAAEEKKKAEIDALAETSLTKMRMKLKELTKEFDDAAKPTKKQADEINNLREKIENAEKATGRHQRGVGSYKEKIMEVAKEFLGFAGAVGIAMTVLSKLKDAFAESEGGVRFFKQLSEASTTFFQNMLSANTGMIGVNTIIATQLAGKLDDLRLEERYEKVKVATLDTEVKLLRLKGASTKDLTEQLKIYTEADKKETESIALRKEHLTKEIEIMSQLLVLRPKDSKLRDELTQKNVEIIQIEGDKNVRIQTKIAATTEKLEQQKADAAKKAEEAKQKAIEASVLSVELANAKEKILINQKLINRTITEDQAKKELENQELNFLNAKQALYKKDSKEWTDIELQKQDVSLKVRDAILKDIKSHGTMQTSAERAIGNDKENVRAEGLKNNKKNLDAQLKQAEKEAEDEKRIREGLKKAKYDMEVQAGNAIFQLNGMALTKQLNQLQVEKDTKLANAKLTTEQRAKIEAEYVKKENELKAKQARAAKLQAVFNIGMSTYQGVMAATAMPPLFALNPMIPWIIGAGILEAGLAIAAPIPKYAKGTQSAQRAGIFGEAGREIMFPVGGGAIIADKPTYFEGSRFKGAKIYSNPETEQLIKMAGDKNIIVRNSHDTQLLDQMKRVENAILSKPVNIIDSEHRIIGQKMSNHQEIYLNRLINRN